MKSQPHLIHWSHHTIPHILSPSTHGHEAQELVQLQLTMMMSRVTYLILPANTRKQHQPKLTKIKISRGGGGGRGIRFLFMVNGPGMQKLGQERNSGGGEACMAIFRASPGSNGENTCRSMFTPTGIPASTSAGRWERDDTIVFYKKERNCHNTA